MERNVVFIALFAALIAALGLIPMLKLFGGVPITAQSLGVMLCGTILGAKRGALAVLLFLLLVFIGLPILAGGRGGPQWFASPSAGFLIGFPIAAFVTGLIFERFRHLNAGLLAAVAAIVGCVLVLYVFGIPGIAYFSDKSLTEAAIGSLLFIPGDLIKAVLAGVITAGLLKARPQSVLSRA